MTEIPFTQYLLPDGRRTSVMIDRPEAVAKLAQQIMAYGYVFECEMLSDYKTVSFTITSDDGDTDGEICINGPMVPERIDAMIVRFAKSMGIEQ